MPTLDLVDCGTLYRNPLPGHQLIHASVPSVLELSPQEFLCVYRRGSAFYAADGVLETVRSTDGGKTWQEVGLVWRPDRDNRPYSYSAPSLTRLADGSLVLTAIRRDGSDPSRLAVNPDTGGFLPVETLLFRSSDSGRTWSAPEVIQIPGRQIVDISGPVVELNDGRWFLPFDLGKAYDDPRPVRAVMIGLFSSDGGRTWGNRVTLADGTADGKGYWHGRVVKLLDGRLFTLLWTADRATGQFLSIHRTVSDPHGRNWSPPEPTDIPGQTSWAVDVGDGRMVAIYTYRDGKQPGINAVASLDGGRTWDLDHQVRLWDAGGRETIGVASTTTYPQSHDVIAFGKPQAIRTSDGDVMASFWCTESCVTHARWARLRLSS
ncbi:MAG: sialidase family protein [Thermomicrobiales bacterium]